MKEIQRHRIAPGGQLSVHSIMSLPVFNFSFLYPNTKGGGGKRLL